MANTEEKILGWDDEIQSDGEYSGEESVILPEGSYDFEVIKTEQAWFLMTTGEGANELVAEI